MNSNDDSMDLVGNERVNKAKVYDAAVYVGGELVKSIRLRGETNRIKYIADEMAGFIERREHFKTLNTSSERYVIEFNGGAHLIVEEVK
jgi:hypothetical protein